MRDLELDENSLKSFRSCRVLKKNVLTLLLLVFNWFSTWCQRERDSEQRMVQSVSCKNVFVLPLSHIAIDGFGHLTLKYFWVFSVCRKTNTKVKKTNQSELQIPNITRVTIAKHKQVIGPNTKDNKVFFYFIITERKQTTSYLVAFISHTLKWREN